MNAGFSRQILIVFLIKSADVKYFNNEFVKCEKKFSVFFPGKSLQGLHTANINAQFGFMAEILFQVAFAKVRKDVTSGTNTSK